MVASFPSHSSGTLSEETGIRMLDSVLRSMSSAVVVVVTLEMTRETERVDEVEDLRCYHVQRRC